MTSSRTISQRRWSRRRLLKGTAAGGMGLAGAALIGCGEDKQAPSGGTSGATSKGAEPTGGELVFSGNPPRASYDVHSDGFTQEILRSVLEQLFRAKADYGAPFGSQFEPWLAQSVEQSPDLLQWTFKLRPGVTFHDGSAFTSRSVVRTVARTTPDKASPLFDAERANFGARVYRYVERVEPIDDLTVRFVLNRPVNDFIGALSGFTSAILSADALEKQGDAAMKTHPVGTGPFQWGEWIRDDHVRVTRFDKYWGGRPKLDSIRMPVIADTNTRMQALITGAIDLNTEVGPDQRKLVRGKPGLKLTEENPGTGEIIMLDSKETFPDKRVRRALALALDLKGFSKSALDGQAVLNNGIFPSHTEFWREGRLPERKFDPVEAKKLIDAAGQKPVSVIMTTGDVGYLNAPRQVLAQFIQSAWAPLGVKVNIVIMPSSELNALSAKGLKPGVNEVLLTGTGLVTVNDIVNKYWSGSQPPNGQNRMWYVDKRVDELISLAQSKPLAEVPGYMQQIEDIVFEDLPIIPVYESRPTSASSDRLGGYPELISAVANVAWHKLTVKA